MSSSASWATHAGVGCVNMTGKQYRWQNEKKALVVCGDREGSPVPT